MDLKDIMFSNIELRQVANGFIVTVTGVDDESKEYIFSNIRQTLRFIKELADTKNES